MVKVNFELEIDWLEDNDEGGIDLNEALKEQMLEKVTEQLTQKIYKSMESRVNNVLDKAILDSEKIINNRLNTLLEEFLTKKRVVTDKWGDVVSKDKSVLDMLKAAADKFLDQKVDRNGDVTTYNANYTRLEWLVNKELDKGLKRGIEKAAEQIGSSLKSSIEDQLKRELGSSISKVISLDEVLKKAYLEAENKNGQCKN